WCRCSLLSSPVAANRPSQDVRSATVARKATKPTITQRPASFSPPAFLKYSHRGNFGARRQSWSRVPRDAIDLSQLLRRELPLDRVQVLFELLGRARPRDQARDQRLGYDPG